VKREETKYEMHNYDNVERDETYLPKKKLITNRYLLRSIVHAIILSIIIAINA